LSGCAFTHEPDGEGSDLGFFLDAGAHSNDASAQFDLGMAGGGSGGSGGAGGGGSGGSGGEAGAAGGSTDMGGNPDAALTDTGEIESDALGWDAGEIESDALGWDARALDSSPEAAQSSP